MLPWKADFGFDRQPVSTDLDSQRLAASVMIPVAAAGSPMAWPRWAAVPAEVEASQTLPAADAAAAAADMIAGMDRGMAAVAAVIAVADSPGVHQVRRFHTAANQPQPVAGDSRYQQVSYFALNCLW